MDSVGVTITNRWATFHRTSEEVYAKLRDFWSFSPKGLWFMPQYKPTKILQGQRAVTVKQLERLEQQKPRNEKRIRIRKQAIAEADEKLAALWDGKIRLLQRSRMSAGLFRATWKEAEEECGVKFFGKKNRATLPIVAGLAQADEKFRHQNVCVAKMVEAIGKGGGIVLAATSSGKTAIGARLFAAVEADCLFVVDQLDLLYQQKKELEDWLGELVGIVGESKFEPKRVTVATIQTLNAYRERPDFVNWFESIEVMVVDELHEQMAKRNFNVLESIEPAAVFGLTATLQLRQKETRMKAYAFAGPVIFSFPLKEGIARKVLTKGYALQLLFRPVPLDEGTKYQEELLAQVVQNELKLSTCRALVGEMIQEMDRHVVVLTDRVAHLKDVASVLQDFPHKLAYGEVEVEERSQAKRDFEQEDIALLIANKVFKKGVSIKRIDAMIDMAEMKSKNDAVQKFGRMLRLHRDKTEALYIDFGTDRGRFGRAATSRRRALQAAGINVTVVKDICSEQQAVKALRKFARKVIHDDSTAAGEAAA